MNWLARIRRRLEAATPGPWAWATDEGAPVYVQLYATDEAVDEYEADVLSSDERGVLVYERNADLIAHAPADLAALLAVAEAARTVLTTCRQCRDEAMPGPDPGEPADFILWGKLFPEGAFGPKCYSHAEEWIGSASMRHIDQMAVVDLRPIRAALAPLTEEENRG